MAIYEAVGNLTLPPLTVAPVTPDVAYSGAAHSLADGVNAIAASGMQAPVAQAFLAAQALECALKAVLARTGVTEQELRSRRLRHNLVALWERAAALGFRSPECPRWVVVLNGLHDQPYYLRYPMALNGLVLPNLPEVAADLSSIVADARSFQAGSRDPAG